MMTKGKPGPANAITDVRGIRVGNAQDATAATGVTVIWPEKPPVAAVDVRGGGPGTRETEVLAPENLVETVNAIVLSGGSVYGLAAADAVAAVLGARGEGFSLVPAPGVPVSPIVPAAILYDLANGGDKNWGETPPYPQLGRKALDAATDGAVTVGRAGAGMGAEAGAFPGGLGSASFVTEDGWQVGALAAVNSFGSPYRPDTRHFWAAPFEIGAEFGGRGMGQGAATAGFPPDTKLAGRAGRTNTTICVVAVNAVLTPAEAKRLAIMAQDGIARAIRPAHGPTDGDVVFALATGAKALSPMRPLDLTLLGSLAADCLTRAIARGVHAAEV